MKCARGAPIWNGSKHQPGYLKRLPVVLPINYHGGIMS